MNKAKILGILLGIFCATNSIVATVRRSKDCGRKAVYVSQPDPYKVKAYSRSCCKPRCFNGRWRTRYLGYPYYQKGNYYSDYPDYPYGINSEGGYARRWW
jgi:hypothetical protein